MSLSRLTRWLHGKRQRLGWSLGAGAALTVVLLSCSNFDTNRTIVAPPSIAGAEYVGTEACDACHSEIVRDFRTATHARLQAKGDNAKEMGCEGCHGPGSLHVQAGDGKHIVNPHKSADACFQCHLEVRAQFQLPHRHPVLEGKMSCTDCHNPHKGRAIKGGGTSLPAKVKGGGNVLLGENDTCLQCHNAQRGPFVFQHGAVQQGCTTCHSPHGSVNQRMLTERSSQLCLKCHFQEQKVDGRIYIGDGDHTTRLQQGACWSAGCHEAVHGSQVNGHLRY